jgi:hypothetical protein
MWWCCTSYFVLDQHDELEYMLCYRMYVPIETAQEQVNFQWDDDEVRFLLDQHAELDFYSNSSLKQQSGVDMSLHSDTLFLFRAEQSLLFLLNAAGLTEKQQIPIS